MLFPYFPPADPNVLPGIRKHACLIPEVFSIVGWAGDEGGGETEVFLGSGIVGAFDGQIDRLSVPQFALIVNFSVIDYQILEGRQWFGMHEYVVPLFYVCGDRRRVP